jgi:hypothetical protein
VRDSVRRGVRRARARALRDGSKVEVRRGRGGGFRGGWLAWRKRQGLVVEWWRYLIAEM